MRPNSLLGELQTTEKGFQGIKACGLKWSLSSRVWKRRKQVDNEVIETPIMLAKKKSISVSIFFLLFPKVQTHIT